MANGNYPENILLALCNPITPAKVDEIRGKLEGGREKQASGRREISQMATQGHQIASHFLPPLDVKGPWLVDFKELVSISKKRDEELLQKRFATITPAFVPNLMQRYAAYLGRIGQPALDVDILIEKFKEPS